MAYKLPTYSNSFMYTIQVESKKLDISISFNNRAQRWYLRQIDIITGDSVVSNSIMNVKMIPFTLLLYPYKKQLNLRGDLIILPIADKTDNTQELTYENLHTDFDLLYFDNDEVRTWREINGI